MLRNKKGTVLVVAIVAIMIMIIIGMICLQMYANQNIIDTYDQARIRTFYTAEGAIEMMRGYINKKLAETRDPVKGDISNFLVKVTPFVTGTKKTTDWYPFIRKNPANYQVPVLVDSDNGNIDIPFDGTMYPPIYVSVTLHRLYKKSSSDSDKNRISSLLLSDITPDKFYASKADPANAYDDPDYSPAYEIVAIASTTHRTSLSSAVISTTLRYYFWTKYTNTGTVDNPCIVYEKKFVGWRKD